MLERLIEQMRWANEETIGWLGTERKEQAAVHRLACHIMNAEEVWIRRVKALPLDKDTFKHREPDELSALNAANNRDLLDMIAGDVSRQFDYVLFNGTPGRSTVLDMILHLYSHGFHHRGQMAALASKSGETFPNTAHIHWSRTVAK